jgi:hypothetical protein
MQKQIFFRTDDPTLKTLDFIEARNWIFNNVFPYTEVSWPMMHRYPRLAGVPRAPQHSEHNPVHRPGA